MGKTIFPFDVLDSNVIRVIGHWFECVLFEKRNFKKMLLSHDFVKITTLFFPILRLFVDRFNIVHGFLCFLDFIFDISESYHLLVKPSSFCLFEVLFFESLTF
jgi:hypothetical protein